MWLGIGKYAAALRLNSHHLQLSLSRHQGLFTFTTGTTFIAVPLPCGDPSSVLKPVNHHRHVQQLFGPTLLGHVMRRKNQLLASLFQRWNNYYQQQSNNHEGRWRRRRRWARFHSTVLPLLAGFNFFGMFGYENWQRMDDDPLKDKIKWAMLHRQRGHYQNAIEVLEEALKQAEASGEPKYVTRVYDEMANTYYQAEQLDKADQLFRMVVHRLITIHRKTEGSPEFIGISLKLANIFARRGDHLSADIGYRHCLQKQMQEVDRTLAKYHVAHGAVMEGVHNVEERGTDYVEPFALMGMCMNEYGLFLMDFHADTRADEAQEYISEALKISYKLFGLNTFHALNIISTFAAKCILKNHFETARKFLEMGLDRALALPECESVSDETTLLSFYCSYAEALFHTGEPDKAVDYADRAVQLASEHADPALRAHVKKFARQLKREALREINGRENGAGSSNNSSKSSSWLWPF